MLVVFSLVYDAADTAYLSSYLSRIAEIENPSCSPRTLVLGHLSSHSALFSYELFAPLTLWRLSVFLRPLVQALESCPASAAPWSSAMPPSLGRGRVTNNNNNNQDVFKECNITSYLELRMSRSSFWPRFVKIFIPKHLICIHKSKLDQKIL